MDERFKQPTFHMAGDLGSYEIKNKVVDKVSSLFPGAKAFTLCNNFIDVGVVTLYFNDKEDIIRTDLFKEEIAELTTFMVDIGLRNVYCNSYRQYKYTTVRYREDGGAYIVTEPTFRVRITGYHN